MTFPLSRPIGPLVKPLAIAVAVSSAISTLSLPAAAQENTGVSPTVVVTATRMPQPARDVLTDFSVISRDQIEQAGQETLVDLLQQQRGVEITRAGGPGTTSSVFIRGASNAQSIVLVDGVRIGSSTLGGATWETIPLSQIDHVEIVYGPMSSLYGADAVGGVVQIFTKQGKGAPHLTASAGAGSYGTRNADARVSGSTGGDVSFRYALQAGHERSDGFSATKPAAGPYTYNPDKDGYKKDSASGQFALDFAQDHEFGLNFLHSRLNAQFDAGPDFNGNLHDDRDVATLNTYALYAKDKFLPAWTSIVQLGRSNDRNDTDASYGLDHIDTVQHTLSWQNNVTVGADVLQLIAERRKEQVDADTTEIARERSTNSLAASYQLHRGDHLASLAVRRDNSSQYDAQNTWNAEYGYRLNDALRVNASYGTSFRAPTFNELYFPGYGIAANQPEKGKNAEAGIYYNSGATRLSAVYFHNHVTDLLVYAPTCPVETDTHPYGCAYNVDSALLTGVSLAGSTQFADLTLRGSLDLQNPRDETTGELLARRAKRHGSIAAEYGVDAYKAGAELVFASERFEGTADSVRLGGYVVLNLYADYTFAREWNLFARWNNVLNKDYELAKNYATPGSNLFVGVRYTMK